jgi:hypothetical protein
VRKRRHETRSGKQRRDEPPSAWQSLALGNRFWKLSWRHVWVAVRCRYAFASPQCLELAPEFALEAAQSYPTNPLQKRCKRKRLRTKDDTRSKVKLRCSGLGAGRKRIA